ncbi:lipase 1 [Folsomia candida]|uniref:Lipase n=1 Tax=Folsomia candida TaxID=158441 RepID=A0A226EE14_FOLCA|nr:lipase 1 [Folsomia candida]OXA55772.1 Lipase 1 [Folsomia candida]
MAEKHVKKEKRKESTHFLEEQGYYTENHEIVTSDGYILNLCRLFKRNNEIEGHTVKLPVPEKKPVALLVHGLLCQAENWCMISSEAGLPYKLLEEGYDCWLPNLRGTASSRKHVSLSTSSKSYWDFSFHEIAVIDLPTIIDYILTTTDNTSLTYIGHSMGCSVFLVLMSTKPEYCSKVDTMIALAPAVYGKHIRNMGFRPIILLGNFVGSSKFIRRREIANEPAAKSVKYIVLKSKRDRLGAWAIKFFGGFTGAFGKSGIEKERLRILSREWPCPTSLKLFCHGLQCYHTNKARQYNYGRAGNMKAYGQPKPPIYDFSKINVPVATFCSEGDELCRPLDVLTLSKQLPNLVGQYYINDDDFSHVDFMLGKRAHEIVFKRVIQILRDSKIKE